MAQVIMGPGAAMYLADQGAEVIKVEPLAGDSTRARLAVQPGMGRGFLAHNRNKRSIAIDIRATEGQEIVHRLAQWADVFILNFRPGSESRVRLDYETLATLNPGLIYASISAFGRDGPEAGLPGYDIVIQARSGILATRRNSDGTPVPSAVMFTDAAGCMGLCYGIMLALWERAKTGKGQRVEMSLLHVGLALQAQQMIWVGNGEATLTGLRPTALQTCYQCADAQWVNIVVLEDRQWKALCRAMELEHLGIDSRFATYEQRQQSATELFQVLEAIFKTRFSSEWLEQLKSEGVPCSAVVEQNDLPCDPQAVANKMFWEEDNPSVGRIKTVSHPINLSNTRNEIRLRRPAPKLGEHTRELLCELGYDDITIGNLYQKGVVK